MAFCYFVKHRKLSALMVWILKTAYFWSILSLIGIFYLGNRIMNLEVPKTQMYPLRLKGISVCFTILKAALCGNYVNFGVCKLYGDETLDNVLDVTTKLILTIPQTDLMVRDRYWNKCNRINYNMRWISLYGIGIPETSTIILFAIRMLGTRPYAIPINTRTSHFSVHYQKYLRGFCCWRYDEFNFWRSFRWIMGYRYFI